MATPVSPACPPSAGQSTLRSPAHLSPARAAAWASFWYSHEISSMICFHAPSQTAVFTFQHRHAAVLYLPQQSANALHLLPLETLWPP